MFAKVRRSEEMINQCVVSGGDCVPEEGFHLGGFRRKAGEVEGDAADEAGGDERLRRGSNPFSLQLGEDEMVDGIAAHAVVVDGGELRLDGGLERPPVASRERRRRSQRLMVAICAGVSVFCASAGRLWKLSSLELILW